MGRPLNAGNNCSRCSTGINELVAILLQRFCFCILRVFLLQSPWGVASGAIMGHLIATSFAIIGGAFLANYISEKLVKLYQNHPVKLQKWCDWIVIWILFVIRLDTPVEFCSSFLQSPHFSECSSWPSDRVEEKEEGVGMVKLGCSRAQLLLTFVNL